MQSIIKINVFYHSYQYRQKKLTNALYYVIGYSNLYLVPQPLLLLLHQVLQHPFQLQHQNQYLGLQPIESSLFVLVYCKTSDFLVSSVLDRVSFGDQDYISLLLLIFQGKLHVSQLGDEELNLGSSFYFSYGRISEMLQV